MILGVNIYKTILQDTTRCLILATVAMKLCTTLTVSSTRSAASPVFSTLLREHLLTGPWLLLAFPMSTALSWETPEHTGKNILRNYFINIFVQVPASSIRDHSQRWGDLGLARGGCWADDRRVRNQINIISSIKLLSMNDLFKKRKLNCYWSSKPNKTLLGIKRKNIWLE